MKPKHQPKHCEMGHRWKAEIRFQTCMGGWFLICDGLMPWGRGKPRLWRLCE